PAGDYFVQAVINVYEQARRSDGHTIWVKLNDGQQETFGVAAGNVYSDVQRSSLTADATIRITIANIIPAATRPADTEWVKHVRIQSQKLTQFWGRPIYINATVLLPKQYAQRTDARYPVVFTFGHNVPFSFSPDSARARNIGQINPVTGVETGYDFYKSWNSDGFPRFIAVSFQQQTPYFPDSYSINSVNNGPYGDALIQEVIPALERQFRMIAKPYARLVEGASTGGWQSLALQLYHPDFFGGAWVLQPDPIDFRRYQHVNIYEDENAFRLPLGQFGIAERPFRRSVEGQIIWTLRELSLFEEVLGSRGRSGWQLQGWEANYGPVGPDGYPRPLWDKLTGKIDHEVANYMREHGFDLREYAQRNWPTLGPKLAGKLHFFAGDMDDFYLNLAVYRFEDFLKTTTNPKSDATFVYGSPMKGHSWHAWTWGQLVREMGEHVRRRAGEDVRMWNY
ncbi:MAG: alpha/beta hydrolase-fold protein, partial [Gemmatimonadota bacterium]